MASSLTNLGEQIALIGDPVPTPTNGGIARLATAVKLFQSSQIPNKDGSGFLEVANGFGYTTGGIAITVADWTFSVVSTLGQIQLADKVFTASGGSILNISGAYIVDAAGDELAWWERTTPTTLTPGDTLTLDDLIIRLT